MREESALEGARVVRDEIAGGRCERLHVVEKRMGLSARLDEAVEFVPARGLAEAGTRIFNAVSPGRE
jgi:hypothetical protein